MSNEVLQSGTGQEFDPYHMMLSAMPYMLEEARNASRHESASYRGFHVGASLFAVDNFSETTRIFSSGNLKTRPERDKVCAEKRVVKLAKKDGFINAIGILVVATTDKDLIEGVTGIRTPTLHPCSDCQDPNGDVAGSGLVDGNTLIITAGIEEDLYQVHYLEELQKAYSEGQSSTLHHARNSFSWEFITNSYQNFKKQEFKRDIADRYPDYEIAKIALRQELTPDFCR